MARCVHCEVDITDPTTQVVHGDLTFCCTSCAEAMEHVAGGSDPRPLSRRHDPRCSRCDTPIVDQRTMETRGDGSSAAPIAPTPRTRKLGLDMQQEHRFSPDILTLIEQTEEVQIEPASTDGEAMQPVTIWIVVDGQDVYVRSVRGPRGRWYQQLLNQRRGKLHVGDRAVAVRAVHVDDPQIIFRVSDAFRRKYESKWPKETADMLRDEVLPTTVRLEPDTT